MTFFFSLFFMWRHWRERGKDPELGAIAPFYDPPADMTPGEHFIGAATNLPPSIALNPPDTSPVVPLNGDLTVVVSSSTTSTLFLDTPCSSSSSTS